MKCFHPLAGVISLRPNKNGNYPLLIKGSVENMEKKGRLTPHHIRVPCGRCIGCRMNYSRQWAIRISHEAQIHEQEGKPCIFVTLTYNDKYLPTNESISKREVQLFLKRLRKYFTGRSIKYYAVGEYGEQNRRPHYHLILFNVDFEDKELWTMSNGNPIYCSPVLTRLWRDPDTKESYGYANFGAVTYESAAYVARYSTKKQAGYKALEHYEHITRYGELVQLEPEFALMSLKKPIGETWLKKYCSDIFPLDKVVRLSTKGAVSMPVPRFYYKKLEKLDPGTYAAVKEQRTDKISSMHKLTFHELQSAKKIFQSKTKSLKRDLEVSL